MPDPLLSIVIPCYNSGKWLPGAIKSIKAQEVAGCEVVIVDDRSTDNSMEVARRLAADDDFIRLAQMPRNGGPAGARNAGLRLARGEYLCFLDADDEYAPGFLSRCLDALLADPTLAAVGTRIALLDCQRDVAPEQLGAVGYSLPCNVVLRRAVAELLGGFPEGPVFRGPAAGEDVAFRRTLQQFFKVLDLDEPLFCYRVQPGSHFEKFLDRTKVEHGRLVFEATTPEEESGAMDAAIDQYQADVRTRLQSIRCSRNGESSITRDLLAVSEYEKLRQRLDNLPGTLQPPDGYALYVLAAQAAINGEIVAVGGCPRAVAWIASGSKSAGRERVTLLRSPRDAALAIESNAPADCSQVHDWVVTAASPSEEVGLNWDRPVRLLYLDIEGDFDAWRSEFTIWTTKMPPRAAIAVHGLKRSTVAGVFESLLESDRAGEILCRSASLGVLQLS